MKPLVKTITLVIFLLATHHQLFAQGTAFTYQGRLNNTGSPANGSYDFTFTLFATNSGGPAIAGPVTNAATVVSNGLFIAIVNLGPVFTGSSNWLEVAVRTNGSGAFNALSPRDQVTPVPYAISAESVSGGISATQLTSGTVPTNVIAGFQGPFYASVGGGQGNTVNNTYGVVDGGFGNTAGYQAVVGGGQNNTASGQQSTVPGGNNNLASGNFSFAVGDMAQATNQGAFVWADSQGTPFRSTNNNSFNVRAGGGVFFATGGAGLKLDGAPVLTISSAPLGITLQQNTEGAPNVIEGSPDNYVAPGIFGAVISGGGVVNDEGFAFSNTVAGYFTTIGGGLGNEISGDENDWGSSVIGGGNSNLILTNASDSTIGGGAFNEILGDVNDDGSSVVGGGNINIVYNNAPFSTIGGGQVNQIFGDVGDLGSSVIGGGYFNIITTNAPYSTIGGGQKNEIYSNSEASVIGGGAYNSVGYNSPYSTVGGGYGNQVGADYATVPGGYDDLAFGYASFAAGDGAQTYQTGTFVWADAEGSLFTASGQNQFLIRAAGGVGIGTAAPQANVDIVSSTGVGDPQLRLVQQNASDYARLRYQTGLLPDWDLAVGGANDQMNWYLPPYGNVMTLQTNGALTANSLTTGTIVSGGLTTAGITVNNDAAIHVSGAGSNTKTAAFVQTVTAGNYNGGGVTTINNPLCNGNPNAILIVTRLWTNITPDTSYDSVIVYYTGGQWEIISDTMNVGDTFNVLIILP